MTYGFSELGGPSVVSQLYPPLNRSLSSTIGDVEGLKNQPFASAIFGYRMASPLPRNPNHKRSAARACSRPIRSATTRRSAIAKETTSPTR